MRVRYSIITFVVLFREPCKYYLAILLRGTPPPLQEESPTLWPQKFHQQGWKCWGTRLTHFFAKEMADFKIIFERLLYKLQLHKDCLQVGFGQMSLSPTLFCHNSDRQFRWLKETFWPSWHKVQRWPSKKPRSWSNLIASYLHREGLRGDYWVLYNYITGEKHFQVSMKSLYYIG